jgi:predicted phage-related endonuclease
LVVTQRRVGATDAPCLIGVDPYRDAAAVFRRLLFGEEIEQTAVMLRGLNIEPTIRALAAKNYDLELVPRDPAAKFIVRSEQHEFATASPDDYAAKDGRAGVAEYKSVSRWSAKKWGLEGTDDIPPHYLTQCHWLMAVTNRSPVWLVAAFGEDLKGEDKKPNGEFEIAWTSLYVVERDPELEAWLLGIGRRFWDEHILTGIEPGNDWWKTKEAA